jgi:hypothetical protein
MDNDEVIRDADDFLKKFGGFSGSSNNRSSSTSNHSNNSNSKTSSVKKKRKDLHNLTDLVNPEHLPERQPHSEDESLLPVGKDGSPIALFSNFRRVLITRLDYYYNENEGEYPKFDELKKWSKPYWDLEGYPQNDKEWTKLLDDLAGSLLNRGLPFYTVGTYYELDPNFVAAVRLLLDVSDKRSKVAKLTEAGLTSAQFTAKMRTKRHREYYTTQLEKVFDEDVAEDAKLAIARGIQVGDLSAVKYYHEFTGKYRPNEQANMNELFVAFTQAVMQSLARHVATDVINIIAAELREAPAISRVLGAIETQEAV